MKVTLRIYIRFNLASCPSLYLPAYSALLSFLLADRQISGGLRPPSGGWA